MKEVANTYTIKQINNNQTDISVIKGNTFRQKIRIQNDERLNYVPYPGDKITFVVKNKYTDENPLFEKRIPYDTLILELTAKETDMMRVGSYVYYIRLQKQDSDVDDFIFGHFVLKAGGDLK